MGPQDGVDLALRAADVLVNQRGRDDVSFLLMGKGDSYDELLSLRTELGLDAYVEMPGRVPDAFVTAALSTADVGLCPGPKNPLNDLSTMNKTMEYMAFGLPVAAFDLRETRVSAGDAAVYATPNDVGELADAIACLLDDTARREQMGRTGRRRVEEELDWSHQREAYLGALRRADVERVEDFRRGGWLSRVRHRGHLPAGRRQAADQRDGRAAGAPRTRRGRCAGERQPDGRMSCSATCGCRSSTSPRPRTSRWSRTAWRCPTTASCTTTVSCGPTSSSWSSQVRHAVRHRGGARGLARLGAGLPRPLPRHVRLRHPRHSHR